MDFIDQEPRNASNFFKATTLLSFFPHYKTQSGLKKRSQLANQESTQNINFKEEGVFHKPENEDENSLSNLSWKGSWVWDKVVRPWKVELGFVSEENNLEIVKTKYHLSFNRVDRVVN